jgi:hypothetical protein
MERMADGEDSILKVGHLPSVPSVFNSILSGQPIKFAFLKPDTWTKNQQKP